MLLFLLPSSLHPLALALPLPRKQLSFAASLLQASGQLDRDSFVLYMYLIKLIKIGTPLPANGIERAEFARLVSAEGPMPAAAPAAAAAAAFDPFAAPAPAAARPAAPAAAASDPFGAPAPAAVPAADPFAAPGGGMSMKQQQAQQQQPDASSQLDVFGFAGSKPAPAPAPAPAPGGFDGFGADPFGAAPAAKPAAAPAPAAAFGGLDDPFGGPAPAAAAAGSSSFDPFGAPAAAQPPARQAQHADPFGFDGFAAAAASHPPGGRIHAPSSPSLPLPLPRPLCPFCRCICHPCSPCLTQPTNHRCSRRRLRDPLSPRPCCAPAPRQHAGLPSYTE